MFDLSCPVYNTIIAYLFIVALIILIKPSFLYDDDKVKTNGMVSFPVFVILISIVLYFLFSVLCHFC